MPRMHHPNSPTVIEVPDDAGCVKVHEEGGWSVVDDPEPTPGLVSEPVVYVPAPADDPEPEPVKRTRKSSSTTEKVDEDT